MRDASGRVGQFPVQLAARTGAEVVAVAREQFADDLARLGAAQTISDRHQQIGQLISTTRLLPDNWNQPLAANATRWFH
ncbi:MAG TPA: hypothetical protein VHC18_08270 [Amycolatopsis sp.]|nr:hypothetical protein [Amycolatopsis sp.]